MRPRQRSHQAKYKNGVFLVRGTRCTFTQHIIRLLSAPAWWTTLRRVRTCAQPLLVGKAASVQSSPVSWFNWGAFNIHKPILSTTPLFFAKPSDEADFKDAPSFHLPCLLNMLYWTPQVAFTSIPDTSPEQRCSSQESVNRPGHD